MLKIKIVEFLELMDFFNPSLGEVHSTHNLVSSFHESLSGYSSLREIPLSLCTYVYQSLLEVQKNQDDLIRGFGPKW